MEAIVNGWELFQKGGLVMYALLLASIFVTAIGIERWIFFKQMDPGRNFARVFSQALQEGDLEAAKGILENYSGLLPDMLRQGITGQGRGAMNIVTFFEVRGGILISRFKRKLYYLNVIVTLAPLLGLLGTINGMISAFSVFDLGAGQAAAITGGTGEALIATAMGLCCAILALCIHAYFIQRTEAIIADMEECCSLVEGMVGRDI